LDPKQALQYYAKVNIKKRTFNRMALTLQYLQKIGAFIVPTDTDTEHSVERVAKDLKETLATQKDGSLHVYTDGSTDPGKKSRNSGVGIYVTDDNHKEVWKGGFHIRSDSNNFIAEMAAASTVVNALPKHTPCTVWIDSLATIQALEKGNLVSERKRVRAAGRLWLNWARPCLDAPNLQFRHVRSHTGISGPAEAGNEKADSIANAYRLQGEKLPPDEVYLKWKNLFVFKWSVKWCKEIPEHGRRLWNKSRY
jgi:hypothetical protein